MYLLGGLPKCRQLCKYFSLWPADEHPRVELVHWVGGSAGRVVHVKDGRLVTLVPAKDPVIAFKNITIIVPDVGDDNDHKDGDDSSDLDVLACCNCIANIKFGFVCTKAIFKTTWITSSSKYIFVFLCIC